MPKPVLTKQNINVIDITPPDNQDSAIDIQGTEPQVETPGKLLVLMELLINLIQQQIKTTTTLTSNPSPMGIKLLETLNASMAISKLDPSLSISNLAKKTTENPEAEMSLTLSTHSERDQATASDTNTKEVKAPKTRNQLSQSKAVGKSKLKNQNEGR